MTVRMVHPDLPDAEIVVAPSAVPIHAGSGWQPVEGQADMGETLPPELQPFEGQPVVRMRHPELEGQEITVAESAVPQHRSNGWLLIDEDEAESVAADVDRLTVEQLRDLARERGAQVSGTKAELQERLRTPPAATADENQQEPGEAAEQNPKEGE